MATDSNGNLVFGRYSAGINNVGSYQVSGWPYMTGSTLNDTIEAKIEFPMVAKSITVMASGTDESMAGVLRVHFASTSATDVVTGRHYFSMSTHGDAVTINSKCKEVYLSAAGGNAGFQLFAEMTHIPTTSMYELTGVGVTSLGDVHPGGS